VFRFSVPVCDRSAGSLARPLSAPSPSPGPGPPALYLIMITGMIRVDSHPHRHSRLLPCASRSHVPRSFPFTASHLEGGVGNALVASAAAAARRLGSHHRPPLRHTRTQCPPLDFWPSGSAASGFAAFQCPAPGRFSGPMPVPSAHHDSLSTGTSGFPILLPASARSCLPNRLARIHRG
jgi:hypothetical protein